MHTKQLFSLRHLHTILFLTGVGLGLALYPILLMSTIGNSKSHQHADVAVVLGARVFADGSPSDALLDRTLAGCDLYHQGLCDMLLFSGGHGDGATSEPQTMRQIALEQGVPLDVIVLDEYGFNTAASAMNTAALCRDHNWTSVIGVTHFYHTPRLKLALRREGISATTHSARRRGMILRKLPFFLARESIAWWAYTLNFR